MSSLFLFIIALAGPWAVHLAPPRQRGVAVVGLVAILLLYGIFASNPLTQWELWIGLLAGIISILVASALGAGRRRGGRDRPARARRPARAQHAPLDDGNEPTGEI